MDRLAVIRAESERFAEVLADAPADARCPTCPDWDARDLLWHLIEVHSFWDRILRSGALTEADVEAVEKDKPERPEAIEDLLTLRAHTTSSLVRQLAELPDDEPRWSWFPDDQTVGFTRRMQTYEAALHRVDAELTAGVPVSALAVDVAAGAIDHCVDVMWRGWSPPGATYEPLSVVELVATDTGDRWSVQLGHLRGEHEWMGGAYDVPSARRAQGGEPVATVSGPVNDLALWAWVRGGEVTIAGDAEARAEIDALHAYGIQ